MGYKKNITGIILSGGKSTRMGEDKGLIKIKGKTFVELVIDAITPLVDKVLIISNYSVYDQFGCQRIKDAINNSGPLAGLYTGLKHSESDYNLVLSCDIPLIKTHILKKIVSVNYNNYDVVQVQSGEKTMPLIALYKKQCQALCLQLLNKNEKRLKVLVSQLNTKTIILDSKYMNCVKNINTQEDLKQMEYEIEN